MTPSPSNLGSNWPTPPESSDFWHVLPCSASVVRDRKRSSITLKKNSTRAFQRAVNQGSTPPLTSSKWETSTSICHLLDNFNNKGRKVCCKVSLYKNGKVVGQSIAFRVVSICCQGVAPFPWYLNAKGPTVRPPLEALALHIYSYSADGTTTCRQLHCKGPLYNWKFWSIGISCGSCHILN